MSISLSNQTCPNPQIIPLSFLLADKQVKRDQKTFPVIDSSIPNNSLFENQSGEVSIITKLPAEVIGEKLLSPIIDMMTKVASKIFSYIYPTSSFKTAYCDLQFANKSEEISSFLRAIEEGQEESAKTFIRQGVDGRDAYDHLGNSPVHIASIYNRAHFIPWLSDHFPINDKNQKGYTPLHLAIISRHLESTRKLIEEGANLTLPWISPEGVAFSPTFLAACSGSIDIFKYLMNHCPMIS